MSSSYFLAIPFLDFADKFLVVSSDPPQVIIGELAILLFHFAFEPHPFPLELSTFMDSPSRGEIPLLQCSYRFGPVLHYLPRTRQYGEKTGSGLVKIVSTALTTTTKTRPTLRSGGGSGHCRVTNEVVSLKTSRIRSDRPSLPPKTSAS